LVPACPGWVKGKKEGVVGFRNPQSEIGNEAYFHNDKGDNGCPQLSHLNQKSWVSSATGEATALLTWLEFPDCNMHRK
jgi:hypothetical protein